jgi:hypothetical protein
MLDVLVATVAYGVDLMMSFMTDGYWKTAGSGLAYFYWARDPGIIKRRALQAH